MQNQLMKKIIAITIFLINIVLYSINSYSAVKKTIAVMNFKGYGEKNIEFLNNAIPEAISTSLSGISAIRIVERSQLGKILNEIALEQTGAVDAGKISRAGKLARADILILGSVSGNQQNTVITFKAVDVQSGRIIDSKTVKAPVSEIFDKTDQAARIMGALISGEGTGRVSVYSNPDDADIYIDGINTGKTPLISYALIKGDHSIRIYKEGYLEHEESVSVKTGIEEKISVILGRSQIRDRTEFGMGIHYLHSTYSDISASPLYTLFMGQTFESVLASIEIGVSYPEHDEKLTSPIGTPFVQKRWYDLYFAHLSISYVPFPHWKYFLPYCGIMGGTIYAIDYRKNTTKEDEEEILTKKAHLSLGLKLGMNVLPYSHFALFFETRYYYQPEKMQRYTYQSNGITGDMTEKSENINFHFITLGGGFKFFF